MAKTEDGWETIGTIDTQSDDGWETVGEIEVPEEDMPEPEVEKMSAAEAALTGLGEGTTFGLGPILAGAGAVGQEVVEDIGDVLGLTTDAELDIPDAEPGLEGLAKAYYSGRDTARRQQERAFEDQPVASLAGNILGGSAVLPGVGGLAAKGGKIGQTAAKVLPKLDDLKDATAVTKAGVAAREGAKAGGLAGFGSGEAKISDPLDVIKETAATAVGGAALGGGLSGLTSGAKKAASFIPGAKTMGVGRKLGQLGVKVKESDIKEAIDELAQGLRTKIGANFKRQGLDKADALQYADEIGLRVNAGEEVDTVVDDIINKGAASIQDQKEKTAFVNSMRTLKGELTEEKKVLDKIDAIRSQKARRMEEKGKILDSSEDANYYPSDYIPDSDSEKRIMSIRDTFRGEGKDVTKVTEKVIEDPVVAIKEFDLENIPLSELDQVINEINRFSGDLTKKAATETERKSRTLAKTLRDMSNAAIDNSDDLADANRKISRLMSALKKSGMKGNVLSNSKTMTNEQTDQLYKFLLSSSDAKEKDRQRFFEYLKEASDTDFNDQEKIADVLREGLKLSKFEEAETGGLISTGRRVAGALGNVIGRGERAARTKPSQVANSFKSKLYKATPEQVLDLADRMLESNSKRDVSEFYRVLQKASESEGKARTALLYGLYQQPAFREALNATGETLLGENEEE